MAEAEGKGEGEVEGGSWSGMGSRTLPKTSFLQDRIPKRIPKTD